LIFVLNPINFQDFSPTSLFNAEKNIPFFEKFSKNDKSDLKESFPYSQQRFP